LKDYDDVRGVKTISETTVVTSLCLIIIEHLGGYTQLGTFF